MEETSEKIIVAIRLPGEENFVSFEADRVAVVLTELTKAENEKSIKARQAYVQFPPDEGYTAVKAIQRITKELIHDPPDQFTLIGNIVTKAVDEALPTLEALLFPEAQS